MEKDLIHRRIEDIQVMNDNGVIIFFDDNSHTYMDPEMAEWLATQILYEEE